MPAKEGGDSTNQEEEEGTPPNQHALPAHVIQGRGRSPTPEEATGGPPEQRALPAHGMQEREGGDPYQATEEGALPKQRALPVHGMQERGRERGSKPQPEGEGGTPPKQASTPFVRGLIQEMGGNPKDLSSPLPTARRSEEEGTRREAQGGSGVGEGAPTPLGGRGTPGEKA